MWRAIKTLGLYFVLCFASCMLYTVPRGFDPKEGLIVSPTFARVATFAWVRTFPQ